MRFLYLLNLLKHVYCVKSVRIQGFSGPHFPHLTEYAFGPNVFSPNAGKNELENSEYGHFSCSV